MAKHKQAFKEVSENPWKDITCGADAAEFAGKIVVFETNYFYYGSQDKTWHQPGSSTYFGYIPNHVQGWSDGFGGACKDQGPDMARVLTMKGAAGACAIISDNLGKRTYDIARTSLKMREATTEEIAVIKEALASSHAVLEYGNRQFAKALALRQPVRNGLLHALRRN